MSLRRKFKMERAPLVDDVEVRRVKEKFGKKRSKQPGEMLPTTSHRKISKVSGSPLDRHNTFL